MADLETTAKQHEIKLARKDQQIEKQSKQIENLVKQMDILVKQMEHQTNPTENQNNQIVSQQTEDQNKKISSQNKQIDNDILQQMKHQNKQIEDQAKQIDNLVQQVNATNAFKNDMIIRNIEDDSSFSPLNTAFQWKFKPDEIRSGDTKFSPPFYNAMNPHCFQLRVSYGDNTFCISFCRYRGKYDHRSDEIRMTENFVFEIHIFGKNGECWSFLIMLVIMVIIIQLIIMK